jgi:hypothetical protein
MGIYTGASLLGCSLRPVLTIADFVWPSGRSLLPPRVSANEAHTSLGWPLIFFVVALVVFVSVLARYFRNYFHFICSNILPFFSNAWLAVFPCEIAVPVAQLVPAEPYHPPMPRMEPVPDRRHRAPPVALRAPRCRHKWRHMICDGDHAVGDCPVRAAELDFGIRRMRMMAPHIHTAIRPECTLQRLIDESEYPSPPYEHDAAGHRPPRHQSSDR